MKAGVKTEERNLAQQLKELGSIKASLATDIVSVRESMDSSKLEMEQVKQTEIELMAKEN